MWNTNVTYTCLFFFKYFSNFDALMLKTLPRGGGGGNYKVLHIYKGKYNIKFKKENSVAMWK